LPLRASRHCCTLWRELNEPAARGDDGIRGTFLAGLGFNLYSSRSIRNVQITIDGWLTVGWMTGRRFRPSVV